MSGSENPNSSGTYDPDTYRPSIPRLSISQTFAGDRLDHGTITRPAATTEPRAHANWGENDDLALNFILQNIDESEQEFVLTDEAVTTSKACWDKLEKRHVNEGPMRQLQLIHEGMSLQFSHHDEPLPTSATKAYQLAKQTLAMGDLTADIMACLFILSGLTNYAHLRTTVNHNISQSTKDKLYTPTDIIRLLENERRLLNADKTTSSPATALLAKTKPNIPSCSNCKKPGHSADYCISPGGSMAGKTIEESKHYVHHQSSLNPLSVRFRPLSIRFDLTRGNPSEYVGCAGICRIMSDHKRMSYTISYERESESPSPQISLSLSLCTIVHGTCSAGYNPEHSAVFQRARRERTSGKNPSTSSSSNKGKIPIHLKDATGRVFTAYLDSADTDSGASAEATPAFAGLASDDLQSIGPKSSDSIKYEGWLAEEEPITSVNWATNSNPIDSVAFSSIIETKVLPFLCDTGATVHISPERADFSNLRSISTKFIKGVGGSSIAAIGMGDIKINLTENDHIMLKDAVTCQYRLRCTQCSNLTHGGLQPLTLRTPKPDIGRIRSSDACST
ncbi:hypothetical protein F5887DRAFT_1175828 [Amanita rubescens]|nr:hypothetical protein F5887DRAFT_1175828 [Amanita rubescens]